MNERGGGHGLVVRPLGTVESPFQSKFGVPRQSGMATRVRSFIRLDGPWRDAMAGLESVSHVWILFWFHLAPSGRMATRARPPRLGGNKRLGVFATRSTHRPNPLGLSLVEVESVAPEGLHVLGLDVLNGTPVLDIKPYLPWVESPLNASNGVSPAPPLRSEVQWSRRAARSLAELCDGEANELRRLVDDLLQFDARPAYHDHPDRLYSVEIDRMRLEWRYPAQQLVELVDIKRLD